ncbi:MAG: hypothetical protein QM770_20345 [Tepidisphaeraceae bacterium]
MKTRMLTAALLMSATLGVMGCDESKDAANKAADNANSAAAKADAAAKDAGAAAKDAAAAAKDATAAAADKTKDATAAATDKAKDAMAGLTDKAKDAAAGAMDWAKSIGGDPKELVAKAKALVGEGKIADAKAILEKIKPYVDKLPADLAAQVKELLPKVGLN